MKRALLILAVAGASVALQTAATAAADLQVVATIKPIHSLAAAVMAGVGEPRLLMDGASSPHTFAMKPSDARMLNAADIILRVSDGLEPFMVKVLASLPKTVRVVTLADTPDLTMYASRSGGTFEPHKHQAGGRAHGHDSHTKKHAHGHNHEGHDSHIWLDPDNAKQMAVHIANVLATEAPEHAARLQANAAALSSRLDQLSEELEQALTPLAGKQFIVFHDAYQYFERRFGLQAAGAVTISPDLAPSAKRLSQIRRKISGLKAVCVFAEPQFEPKLVRTIAEGTNARTGSLDPIGASEPAGPDLYFTVVRSLASDLKKCLEPE